VRFSRRARARTVAALSPRDTIALTRLRGVPQHGRP
jgi:hypothetical protein